MYIWTWLYDSLTIANEEQRKNGGFLIVVLQNDAEDKLNY